MSNSEHLDGSVQVWQLAQVIKCQVPRRAAGCHQQIVFCQLRSDLGLHLWVCGYIEPAFGKLLKVMWKQSCTLHARCHIVWWHADEEEMHECADKCGRREEKRKRTMSRPWCGPRCRVLRRKSCLQRGRRCIKDTYCKELMKSESVSWHMSICQSPVAC